MKCGVERLKNNLLFAMDVILQLNVCSGIKCLIFNIEQGRQRTSNQLIRSITSKSGIVVMYAMRMLLK